MNKNEARKQALLARKNENKAISSEIALNSILKLDVLKKYKRIGLYYPIGKEIDLMKLLNEYPQKEFYLPITKEDIAFIRYNLNDELIDGPFNTKEPVGEIVDRDSIECFIIPCVAINKDMQRIGYGKGYYDRYLEGYKGYKIGVCYNNSIGLDVKCDEFDIVLDYVITGWLKW